MYMGCKGFVRSAGNPNQQFELQRLPTLFSRFESVLNTNGYMQAVEYIASLSPQELYCNRRVTCRRVLFHL